MSPRELRAFRESLGLSRREFAPKLFISEPTLERWERGQGGPREVHLQILRRMRDHTGAGHSLTYFQYDATASAIELPQEDKQVITETLRSLSVVLLEEQSSDDGGDWALRFGLGWAMDEAVDLLLICEGSDRPERPIIDFTLEISADWEDTPQVNGLIQETCNVHKLFWKWVKQRAKPSTLALCQRVFSTGCNPETVKHVLGNFRSCWEKLEKLLGSTSSASLDRLIGSPS